MSHACALTLLRWVTAVVLLIESGLLLVPGHAARAAAHGGTPQWVPLALTSVEIVAAILFLVPGTVLVGGRTLLAVFAVAALIHVLHGQFHIEVLAVYAAAVLAVITAAQPRTVERS
jgi:hypothetical protein